MEDRARTRMSPYFADPPSPTPSSQSLGEDVVVTGHPSSIPSATEFRSAPPESPGTASQDYVLRRRVRAQF